jgi:hemerythrin
VGSIVAIPKTRIGTIDSDHLKLLNLIDSLLHSIEAQAHPEISASIVEIIFHLEAHCEQEEELMRRVNYPDYDNHKARHQDILMKCNKADDDFTSHQDCKELTIFIAAILIPWLHTHASLDDMAMSEYLHSNSTPPIKAKGLSE